MARSIWKGPFVEESLIKKVEKEKNNPTYATISPADLTSFNSIDKTYLNFKKITIIVLSTKFLYRYYVLFLILPPDSYPKQMYRLY